MEKGFNCFDRHVWNHRQQSISHQAWIKTGTRDEPLWVGNCKTLGYLRAEREQSTEHVAICGVYHLTVHGFLHSCKSWRPSEPKSWSRRTFTNVISVCFSISHFHHRRQKWLFSLKCMVSSGRKRNIDNFGFQHNLVFINAIQVP